jgi:hypothetical protein
MTERDVDSIRQQLWNATSKLDLEVTVRNSGRDVTKQNP